MRTVRYFGWRLFFIPLILIAIVAFGAVTMFLWNELMPFLFDLPVINFWQAIGLLILGRLFFGGGKHYGRWGRNNWRWGMEDKLSKMSPEEREDFWKKVRHRHHPCYQVAPQEKEEVKSETNE